MHYITLDYQTKKMGVVCSTAPSSGMRSFDLWVWPMGSCDLISHAHRSCDRSHGTYHSTPSSHCIVIVPKTPYLLSYIPAIPNMVRDCVKENSLENISPDPVQLRLPRLDLP